MCFQAQLWQGVNQDTQPTNAPETKASPALTALGLDVLRAIGGKSVAVCVLRGSDWHWIHPSHLHYLPKLGADSRQWHWRLLTFSLPSLPIHTDFSRGRQTERHKEEHGSSFYWKKSCNLNFIDVWELFLCCCLFVHCLGRRLCCFTYCRQSRKTLKDTKPTSNCTASLLLC